MAIMLSFWMKLDSMICSARLSIYVLLAAGLLLRSRELKFVLIPTGATRFLQHLLLVSQTLEQI